MTTAHPRLGPPPEPNRPEFPFVGTIQYHGLLVLVENDVGDVRAGIGPTGEPWSVTMRHPYGEIAGTQGVDGDAVDVFVGPDRDAAVAYVVHQEIGSDAEGEGGYDEDKVFLGFDSEAKAVAAYRANFPIKGKFAQKDFSLRVELNFVVSY